MDKTTLGNAAILGIRYITISPSAGDYLTKNIFMLQRRHKFNHQPVRFPILDLLAITDLCHCS
jgi:hypothetical protein